MRSAGRGALVACTGVVGLERAAAGYSGSAVAVEPAAALGLIPAGRAVAGCSGFAAAVAGPVVVAGRAVAAAVEPRRAVGLTAAAAEHAAG